MFSFTLSSDSPFPCCHIYYSLQTNQTPLAKTVISPHRTRELFVHHCIDWLFRTNYINRKFSIWQHQMLFCRKVTNISSQPEGKPGRLHWLNVSFMGVGFWKSTTKLNKIAYWNMHGIKILMTGTGQMVRKVCSNMFL